MDLNKIYVIDDDIHILEYIEERLSNHDYEVSAFKSARAALKEIEKKPPDLVITDVKMDEMTGDEILNHLKKTNPDIGVILITGFGNITHSVNAMRKGAFDYITKPFTGSEFLSRVEHFFNHQSRTDGHYPEQSVEPTADSDKPLSKNKDKQQTPDRRKSNNLMVGDHSKIKKLHQILEQIAPTHAPVLIQGESGTGKEVYANLIRENSKRVREPFIKINCANLPSELVESTLFGHVKGSFTGAVNDYDGAFKKADKGTLLLDEITETDIKIQAKLLRVLQENEFTKVGSQTPQKVDVRIIATTNRNPAEAIEKGLFRSDLYYRLNVFPIRIPPLRERKNDIPILAQFFCDKYSNEHNLPAKKISDKLQTHLLSKSWSGNVRELENYILRGVIMAQKEEALGIEHCDNDLFKNMDEDRNTFLSNDFKLMPIDEMELLMIKKALEQTGGNQKEAAKLLNVSDRTIRNKLKKIEFPDEEE